MRAARWCAALAAIILSLSSGAITAPHAAAALPSSFSWSSSGVLISPKSDSTHNILAVKDPTVVRHNNRWWTGNGIIGNWTPLAATEANPFARAKNVTFPSGAWTQDISHGEMIRAGIDQTMEISSCRMQYLYQGMAPGSGGDYNRLPWRLGLLTQTNSNC